MQHITRVLSVFCAVALFSGVVAASDRFAFKSESFDLPTGDRVFTGPGADPVNNNCLTCHSAGMITVQPKLSKAKWISIVDKMIHVYKAPVPDNDVAAIVEYLSGTPAASK